MLQIIEYMDMERGGIGCNGRLAFERGWLREEGMSLENGVPSVAEAHAVQVVARFDPPQHLVFIVDLFSIALGSGRRAVLGEKLNYALPLHATRGFVIGCWLVCCDESNSVVRVCVNIG